MGDDGDKISLGINKSEFSFLYHSTDCINLEKAVERGIIVQDIGYTGT